MEWLEDALEEARLDITEEANKYYNPDLDWMDDDF